MVLLCLAAAGFARDESPRARPISEAERAGVEIAADFLRRGPVAFWDKLATGAPLRQLQQSVALDEIEVRTGPHRGAVWQLQTVVPSLQDRMAVFAVAHPSGLDETLIVSLVNESGAWKVQDLRILAEPTPGVAAQTAASVQSRPISPTEDRSDAVLFLGLTGVAFAIAAASLRAKRQPPPVRLPGAPQRLAAPPSRIRQLVSPMLSVAAVAFVAGGIMLASLHDSRFQRAGSATPEPEAAPISGHRLGALLPLRRALTTGSSELSAEFTPATLRHDVARLWKAQVDLQQMRTEAVDKTLREFPSPSNVPLSEILRARLALVRSGEVDAVFGYERAINLGPGRDALWHEAAQILSILGYEEQAKTYFDRLARVGSRDPDVYYTLAMLAASENNVERAEELMLLAWKIRPVRRAELIETAVLWEVLRRPRVAAAIRVSSAEEARFASPDVSSRPIQFPAGAVSRVSGDFLHVQIDEQELLVPGGAALAPRGAPAVDASEWDRAEENKALQQLPGLLASAQNAGVFTQPAMRRKIEATASALAHHNRWSELIQLTDTLSPKAENVPTDLFLLRGTALQRLRKTSDAKRLYADLAVSRTLQRRNDAHTMLELGEMLQSVEMFDVAVKLMERAGRIREVPYLDERIQQILMNKRLATAFQLHQSANFDVRYPREMSVMDAARIGEILEKELARLRKFVPLTSFERVTVNILPWNEFRSTYTGGSEHILGFYNGKITLPFAGVPVHHPELVAILTHELTHAMVAQASNDQAPRWFQEGIAQRMEMRPYHANAFNMYDDDKLFSMAVLDAVLHGSPDPEMMQEAYIQAQTVIRYLEARYGWKGVQQLIAAYRGGATTEQGFERLWKQSVAAFDTQLRAWGRGEERVFENPAPILYFANPLEDQIRFSNPKRRPQP